MTGPREIATDRAADDYEAAMRVEADEPLEGGYYRAGDKYTPDAGFVRVEDDIREITKEQFEDPQFGCEQAARERAELEIAEKESECLDAEAHPSYDHTYRDLDDEERER